MYHDLTLGTCPSCVHSHQIEQVFVHLIVIITYSGYLLDYLYYWTQYIMVSKLYEWMTYLKIIGGKFIKGAATCRTFRTSSYFEVAVSMLFTSPLYYNAWVYQRHRQSFIFHKRTCWTLDDVV